MLIYKLITEFRNLITMLKLFNISASYILRISIVVFAFISLVLVVVIFIPNNTPQHVSAQSASNSIANYLTYEKME